MNILILYSSKYGATEKCANLINDNLESKADVVNLKNRESIDNLNDYDTIIIGGGIYAGKFRSEVSDFIKVNQDCLRNKNIGVFLCCKDKDNTMKYMKANLPNWIIDRAFTLKHLGYEINMDKMNFMENFLFKFLFKIKESYSELNYELIDEIATEIKKTGEING